VGPEEIVQEVVRIALGTGLSEDVVYLLETKATALAWQINELEKQNAELQQENHRLLVELQSLHAGANGRGEDLDPKTGEILKYFYDQNRDVSDFEIATHFQLDMKTASKHTEVLLKRRLIEVTWEEIQTWHGNCPPLFCIVDAGRNYIRSNWAKMRTRIEQSAKG